MATEELYEVERIVDRRRSRKGRVEYRVRWRGYGSEGDTWEPEGHLCTCMAYVHDFNRQHAERPRTLLRSTRSQAPPPRAPPPQAPPPQAPPPQAPPPQAPPPTTPGAIQGAAQLGRDCLQAPLGPLGPAILGPAPLGPDLPGHLGPAPLGPDLPGPIGPAPAPLGPDLPGPAPLGPAPLGSPGPAPLGPAPLGPGGSARRSVDLSKTGIKILVPRSPMNSRPDWEESASEALSLEPGAQESPLEPPEVALLQKAPPLGPGEKAPPLGPGEERARMGTRPRNQNPLPPPRTPATPAAMCSLSGPGGSSFMEAAAAGVQSAAAGAGSATGKRRPEERRPEERCAFDKRLRFSVRQTESAYRYRDIVVKKQDGFTHILLSTKSSENNTLNPEVMKEIQSAMATAAADDSRLLLLGAVGGAFCGGLDLRALVRRLAEDRPRESARAADALRALTSAFIHFHKPIVAAVGGPALGLGAALLPLCDVVWANEKAWFQTPYAAMGQTPDACSSLTFPRVLGLAAANELLLGGRKLTAQEACSKGLVSQVLWPNTFTQEVMLRVRELLALDPMVLRESKALVRSCSRGALEQANERECEALKRVWGSPQGTDSILQYLQRGAPLH